MIRLTRFNHTEIIINADLVETLEATPDTVVTLVTGRKVLALETVDEVVQRVITYRKTVGPLILRLDGARANLSESGEAEP